MIRALTSARLHVISFKEKDDRFDYLLFKVRG